MARKTAPKVSDFQNKLFVTRDDESDGVFFYIAHKDLDSVEPDQTVGIYELVGTAQLKVTRELV